MLNLSSVATLVFTWLISAYSTPWTEAHLLVPPHRADEFYCTALGTLKWPFSNYYPREAPTSPLRCYQQANQTSKSTYNFKHWLENLHVFNKARKWAYSSQPNKTNPRKIKLRSELGCFLSNRSNRKIVTVISLKRTQRGVLT